MLRKRLAFIEEQADHAFNAIARPEEDAEKELVYKVTDENGNLLGGCIMSADGLKTASTDGTAPISTRSGWKNRTISKGSGVEMK